MAHRKKWLGNRGQDRALVKGMLQCLARCAQVISITAPRGTVARISGSSAESVARLGSLSRARLLNSPAARAPSSMLPFPSFCPRRSCHSRLVLLSTLLHSMLR